MRSAGYSRFVLRHTILGGDDMDHVLALLNLLCRMGFREAWSVSLARISDGVKRLSYVAQRYRQK